MKVHRDLIITGTPAALEQVIAGMTARATGHWSRDEAAEQELNKRGTGQMYCFMCGKDSNHPEARVWLAPRRDGELYVSALVPVKSGSMDVDECNRVMEELVETLVQPSVEGIGVDVQFSAAEVDVSEWLTKDTAKKLRAFSGGANKETGSSHPADHMRWLEFVIAAHLERANLHSSDLMQWLVDEEGWSEEAADDLAIEYEQGRDLLRAYDKHRHLD